MRFVDPGYRAILVPVAACALLMVTAPRSLADEQGNERTVLDKSISLGERPYRVWMIEAAYERELIDRDGAREVHPMAKLEMFLQPTDGKPQEPRRIWARYGPDPEPDGAVTGRPIADVAVWERENKRTLVLALANTYYHWKQVFEIDPNQNLPPIPRKYIRNAKGEWTPPMTKARTDTSLLSIDVPKDVYGVLTGTREITIGADENGINLSFQPVGKPRVALTCDVVTRSWSRKKAAATIDPADREHPSARE